MLMLMGSADRLPEAPLEPVRFIEDMTDAELSSAVSHTHFYSINQSIVYYIDGHFVWTA